MIKHVRLLKQLFFSESHNVANFWDINLRNIKKNLQVFSVDCRWGKINPFKKRKIVNHLRTNNLFWNEDFWNSILTQSQVLSMYMFCKICTRVWLIKILWEQTIAWWFYTDRSAATCLFQSMLDNTCTYCLLFFTKLQFVYSQVRSFLFFHSARVKVNLK